MAFKPIKDTILSSKPAKDPAAFIEALTKDSAELVFQNERTNDGWIKVRTQDGTIGFVFSDDVKEVPDAVPPPVDEAGYVRSCLIAEHILNDLASTTPWFVAADFVIARAIFETDISNTAPAVGKDTVGPLQVSVAEWDDFLKVPSDFNKDYTAAERVGDTTQVRGGTFAMHTAAKAFSAAATQAGQDPVLPSYLDVFHAYLTSPKAAVAIRDAALDGANKAKPIGELLDKLVADPANGLTADKVAALFARNKLKGKVDKTKSVADFAAATGDVLSAALAKAFDLIKEHAPDEIPQAPAAGGKPAWFTFAESQLNPPTKEGDPEADKRIIAYFNATDINPKPTTSKTPWCGAFVATAMDKAGLKSSIPKEASLAVNWKTWGVGLPAATKDIPLGAVIVMAPAPNTHSSGHVAFFESRPNDRQIRLLGGNQSNAVSLESFLIANVVAIRVPEGAGGGAPAGIAAAKFNMAATGVPQERFKFADMIIDRFTRAGFSRPAQLAAAIANAVLESGLDPTIKAKGAEQSFGLFQCNINNGLGKGFSIPELTNPEINIGIIIKECLKKAFPTFRNATTIEEAVKGFVLDIERPREKQPAIDARTALARKLLKA